MEREDTILRRIFGEVELETIRKKINEKKLKQTEKNYLSRSIRPKLMAAQIATQQGLLGRIGLSKKKDASLIEFNLQQYGYPLFGSRKAGRKKIPLEEFIGLILTAYPAARYIEAIPILLLKNRIDPMAMLDIAARHDIKNQIGFLIDIAQSLKPLRDLEPLLRYLEKSKKQEKVLLVEGDWEFLEKTSPPRVKKWNLLGRFFDEDFRAIAEAYL